MWILENSEAFDGRRLWLRPGKIYLFGRTAAEPGQLAISHNTISRKHLTITVSPVEKGQAHNPTSRSTLTIEDLATKIGTVVNGEKIKGKKKVIEGTKAEFTMGKCPNTFCISWEPVVFAFSFTSKELQTDPLTTLRKRFEQLDIKLVTEYVNVTTHVVSKKRNTAKGLQALINGKHIVTETFLDAVVEAGSLADGAEITDLSPLEQDFKQNWPDALQHLPPRGGEPVQHPDSTYAPDPARQDIFEGYTFIFYDDVQYNNLLAPITNGGGKALLRDVVPEETQVDDFVQYVKNVAGEKGLGAFNDGSEGKGVVVVRFVPSKGGSVDWYVEFFRAVSLRLDHRPIEQSEFLEAILIKDASILRRPLEVETSPQNTQNQHQTRQEGEVSNETQQPATQAQPSQSAEDSQPAPRRGRTRRTVKRRFAGFDDDADIDMDDTPLASVPAYQPPTQAATQAETQAQGNEDGLFVSQEADIPLETQPSGSTRSSQRKRRASPLPEDNLMDGMTTAAERFKRQRIERGEDMDEPAEQMETQPAKTVPKPKKKIKKEFDILALAAQNKEEEEARARAEKEDLANLPDDVDLSEIRRLNIVEEIEIRQPSHGRTREQDIRDGRWDPKWNGMKNFKKFRQRGEATGRQPARTIVPLTQVKTKEFGVGDDYWLEDEETDRRKRNPSQPPGTESQPSAPAPAPSRTQKRTVATVLSDSSDDENNQGSQKSSAPATRTRGAQAAASQTQSQANTKSQSSRNTSQASKRAAAEPAAGQQPAKRTRQTRKAIEIADSDDSDDELKFRFGKRR
ncbi:Ff.00g024540.m01.CDS01 [Fusarium sp. VM40]|nr:Ff.00g024540.m01.CDS01 [Fusarium sp. VM40]